MIPTDIPTTHISLPEFLKEASMSRCTFFTRYRNDPAYADMLDVRTDRMHRIWLARSAATALRDARRAKASHGNRGKAPVRICSTCGYKGHPRHQHCHNCFSDFSPAS